MRFSFYFCIAILLIAGGISVGINRKPHHIAAPKKSASKVEKDNEYARLYNYGLKAKIFTARRAYCKKYCFLVDMRMPSGKKRFFLYDLSTDSVIASGLVAHGSGSQTTTEELQFSNNDGSHASSLGKYRTGQEYSGDYGLAFKLFGLDTDNSNAYARNVVLHAHPLIPAEEVWPAKICTSWGCPTVNPDFLLVLKKYINKADEPVLLWMFY